MPHHQPRKLPRNPSLRPAEGIPPVWTLFLIFPTLSKESKTPLPPRQGVKFNALESLGRQFLLAKTNPVGCFNYYLLGSNG